MDPITAVGAVASILTLAQTAISLSQTLYTLGSAVASASEDVQILADDLKMFAQSLTLLSRLLEDSKSWYSDDVYLLTAKIIRDCADLYVKIDKILVKLSGNGKSNWKLRVKFVYKEGQIRKLMKRLRDMKGTLATILMSLQVDLQLSLLNISSSSKIQRQPEKPLDEATIKNLKSAQQAVQANNFFSKHAVRSKDSVQHVQQLQDSVSEDFSSAQSFVLLQNNSREPLSPARVRCTAVTGSVFASLNPQQDREESFSSDRAIDTTDSKWETVTARSIKSASSVESFKSAVSAQETDNWVEGDRAIKSVQSVLHAFRTALNILDNLVDRRMHQRSGGPYSSAIALRKSLVCGDQFIDKIFHSLFLDSPSRSPAFKESNIKTLAGSANLLLRNVVTKLHMLSAEHEDLQIQDFNSMERQSDECRSDVRRELLTILHRERENGPPLTPLAVTHEVVANAQKTEAPEMSLPFIGYTFKRFDNNYIEANAAEISANPRISANATPLNPQNISFPKMSPQVSNSMCLPMMSSSISSIDRRQHEQALCEQMQRQQRVAQAKHQQAQAQAQAQLYAQAQQARIPQSMPAMEYNRLQRQPRMTQHGFSHLQHQMQASLLPGQQHVAIMQDSEEPSDSNLGDRYPSPLPPLHDTVQLTLAMKQAQPMSQPMGIARPINSPQNLWAPRQQSNSRCTISNQAENMPYSTNATQPLSHPSQYSTNCSEPTGPPLPDEDHDNEHGKGVTQPLGQEDNFTTVGDSYTPQSPSYSPVVSPHMLHSPKPPRKRMWRAQSDPFAPSNGPGLCMSDADPVTIPIDFTGNLGDNDVLQNFDFDSFLRQDSPPPNRDYTLNVDALGKHTPRGGQSSVSQPDIDEDPYRIKCICEYSDDDGDTICCEACDTWQHIKCFYPDQIAHDLDTEDHLCADCKPRPLDRQLATERQGQQREMKRINDDEGRKKTRRHTKTHKKRAKCADSQFDSYSSCGKRARSSHRLVNDYDHHHSQKVEKTNAEQVAEYQMNILKNMNCRVRNGKPLSLNQGIVPTFEDLTVGWAGPSPGPTEVQSPSPLLPGLDASSGARKDVVRPWLPIPMDPSIEDDRPLFVNPKQFDRIVKRRRVRQEQEDSRKRCKQESSQDISDEDISMDQSSLHSDLAPAPPAAESVLDASKSVVADARNPPSSGSHIWLQAYENLQASHSSIFGTLAHEFGVFGVEDTKICARLSNLVGLLPKTDFDKIRGIENIFAIRENVIYVVTMVDQQMGLESATIGWCCIWAYVKMYDQIFARHAISPFRENIISKIEVSFLQLLDVTGIIARYAVMENLYQQSGGALSLKEDYQASLISLCESMIRFLAEVYDQGRLFERVSYTNIPLRTSNVMDEVRRKDEACRAFKVVVDVKEESDSDSEITEEEGEDLSDGSWEAVEVGK